MRKDFWKIVLLGIFWTLAVLAIMGIPWAKISYDHVSQTRFQATYLAELSGYQIEGISDSVRSDARLMAEFTEKMVSDRENPEQELYNLLVSLETTDEYENGSCLVQLIYRYPGAINLALKGEISSAQELQEKWRETRHVEFNPYGTILMFIFLAGIIITIIVASELLLSEIQELERTRNNWHESHDTIMMERDTLKGLHERLIERVESVSPE